MAGIICACSAFDVCIKPVPSPKYCNNLAVSIVLATAIVLLFLHSDILQQAESVFNLHCYEVYLQFSYENVRV